MSTPIPIQYKTQDSKTQWHDAQLISSTAVYMRVLENGEELLVFHHFITVIKIV